MVGLDLCVPDVIFYISHLYTGSATNNMISSMNMKMNIEEPL